MTRTALILLASLGLGACGDNTATNNTAADTNATAEANLMTGPDGTTAAAGGTETATTTPDFVAQMAMSDMYEIEASKIASAKAKGAEVKAFAQMMIKDHTATTAKVKAIVAEDKLAAPPTALDKDHADMIQKLKDASAEDFDTTYLDQQTTAHQKALALLNGYAAGGENAKLKAFAAETAPKVQMHLDKAKSLDEGGADDTASGGNHAM